MRKLFVPALALLTLTYAMLAQAQRAGGPPAMPPEPGSLPSRNFEKVAEGVYYATSTGSIVTASNAVVLVNEEDVLIVDPGITAGAAQFHFNRNGLAAIPDSHSQFRAHSRELGASSALAVRLADRLC